MAKPTIFRESDSLALPFRNHGSTAPVAGSIRLEVRPDWVCTSSPSADAHGLNSAAVLWGTSRFEWTPSRTRQDRTAGAATDARGWAMTRIWIDVSQLRELHHVSGT